MNMSDIDFEVFARSEPHWMSLEQILFTALKETAATLEYVAHRLLLRRLDPTVVEESAAVLQYAVNRYSHAVYELNRLPETQFDPAVLARLAAVLRHTAESFSQCACEEAEVKKERTNGKETGKT